MLPDRFVNLFNAWIRRRQLSSPGFCLQSVMMCVVEAKGTFRTPARDREQGGVF